MTAQLLGKKFAFLVASEGVEQAELTQPWEAIEQESGLPILVGLHEGSVQAYQHLDKGDTGTRPGTSRPADAVGSGPTKAREDAPETSLIKKPAGRTSTVDRRWRRVNAKQLLLSTPDESSLQTRNLG